MMENLSTAFKSNHTEKDNEELGGIKSAYCVKESTLFNEKEWKKYDSVRHHNRYARISEKKNSEICTSLSKVVALTG